MTKITVEAAVERIESGATSAILPGFMMISHHGGPVYSVELYVGNYSSYETWGSIWKTVPGCDKGKFHVETLPHHTRGAYHNTLEDAVRDAMSRCSK
jgi:hypothetical protein